MSTIDLTLDEPPNEDPKPSPKLNLAFRRTTEHGAGYAICPNSVGPCNTQVQPVGIQQQVTCPKCSQDFFVV